MLSANFYIKNLLWQIIFDGIIIAVFALIVISIFNEGLIDHDLIPAFSIVICLCFAIRLLYLIITSLRALLVKKWGLFAGCLIHTLIMGGMFYASLFPVALTIGSLAGGTAGH